MRRYCVFFVFVVLFAGWGCVPESEEITVMSFNIRYANPDDGDDYWDNRKEQVVDLIEARDCDVLGLQEALPSQINYLEKELPGYTFIWRTREADSTQGEATPVLFKTDSWVLVDSETFWLSDTPEIPGSNTWKAACNRVVTWVLLKAVDSGKEVIVCNAHYDHVSQEARLRSSQLILKRIPAVAKDIPVVLLGDLNGSPENEAITVLTQEWYDPYPDFYPEDTLNGTFHGFKGSRNGKRIDYVLVTGHKAVNHIEIDRSHKNGSYPSDHFPVFAEIAL